MRRVLTFLCWLVAASLVVLLIKNVAFSEETAQATPLQGMRGRPINLPDISIIGVFSGHVSDDKADATADRFEFDEIETAFQGYVYPDIRADAFLAIHNHDGVYEAEICEAKASFLNIIGGLAGEVGKIHVNFGKLNKVHTHHRPMIDQPAVLTKFFGNHGLVAQGGTLSYLLPLPFYFQIEGGAWRAASGHTHSHNDAETNPEFALADELYTGRARATFALSKKSELELGGSAAGGKGAHYCEHEDRVTIVGADLTFKYWPSSYERLTFQNEWLYLTRKVPVGKLYRNGMYSFLNWRFNKYFDLGGRFDYAEGAFPRDDNGNISIERALTAIATYHLTETTYVRAQYKHRNIDGQDVTEGWVNLTFGLGPHSHELE